MSGRAPRGGRKGCGGEWQRLLILVLVPASVFANSAFGGFVFDDHEAIKENPDVR